LFSLIYGIGHIPHERLICWRIVIADTRIDKQNFVDYSSICDYNAPTNETLMRNMTNAIYK
ncbi:MAG: hypothetical protein AAFV93_10265, partial [Chloroflexota bacterium]